MLKDLKNTRTARKQKWSKDTIVVEKKKCSEDTTTIGKWKCSKDSRTAGKKKNGQRTWYFLASKNPKRMQRLPDTKTCVKKSVLNIYVDYIT